MIEATLRPIVQGLFIDAPAKRLAARFTGNQITFVSLLCGLLALPFIAWQLPLFATCLLLLSGLFDIIDGTVARIRGESSMMGAIYDNMADRAVESAVVIGLFLAAPELRGVESLVMLAAILLCVTSFLLAGIADANTQDAQGKSFNYSPGLMERAEAFIFFLAMIWLPDYFTPLAWLFSALVLYTGLKRLSELRTMLNG